MNCQLFTIRAGTRPAGLQPPPEAAAALLHRHHAGAGQFLDHRVGLHVIGVRVAESSGSEVIAIKRPSCSPVFFATRIPVGHQNSVRTKMFP